MPSLPTSKSAARREFFRTSARYVALAVLAALGAIFYRRGGPFAGAVCIGSGTCGGCPRQRTCQLPPARAAASRRQPS